jgi:hypothetical protein
MEPLGLWTVVFSEAPPGPEAVRGERRRRWARPAPTCGLLTCLVREVRYNVNLETRDEDVVWIGEHGPYRHHIG